MSEKFKKPDHLVKKHEFSKVMFYDRSSTPNQQDSIAERRALAQQFVESPINVEDYRHLMWQLHEEYRQFAESCHEGVKRFEQKQKSPAAFTYRSPEAELEIEAQRIERARLQAEYELAQQIIWNGMQALGKNQKPDDAFYEQVHMSFIQTEKQEKDAFEASRRTSADPYLLDQWKQIARKKQILAHFENFLRKDR
ncbi:hypothetical protein IT408_03530 [Candidatus Uhrbacteria bacterium]|nr:hypothetical protein [Candidatus Uhrbacteria bacterium]